MMDRYVIVKGCAGLGNRLMTVAAALEYAQKTNRMLYVDWADGFFAPKGQNAFNCLFGCNSELYLNTMQYEDDYTFYPVIAKRLPANFCIYDFFSVRQPENRYIRKFLSIVNKVVTVRYRTWVGQDNSKLDFGGDLPFNLNEDVVIYADYIPQFSDKLLTKNIYPASWICDKIELYIKENGLSQNSVGLHIRATDKKPKRNILSFYKKLDTFIQKKDIKKIYLATDNVEVEETLKKRYGEGICVWPKFLPEISGGGIHHFAKDCGNESLTARMAEESVIDMFMLSRMEYLFYQRGSTFSEVSRLYHQEKFKQWSWTDY